MRQVHTGDCVAGMAAMAENSVDAIVCDPPYGLEFMGKEWDRLGDVRQPNDPTFHRSGAGPFDRAKVRHGAAPSYGVMAGQQQQEWHHRWAVEALRVLKPGGHLLAFGGTRTFHRLVCALEDAGFEIRDTICWLYGSGFPKSLNVGKATASTTKGTKDTKDGKGSDGEPDAARWDGWGTALKPAHEPICVARKPLSERNVASNVLRWGTGGVNVDGCRVASNGRPQRESLDGVRPSGIYGDGTYGSRAVGVTTVGRWPANVCVDEAAAEMLDEQSGELTSGLMRAGQQRSTGGGYHGNFPACATAQDTPGDPGGASRFFYCAKAGRAERNAGLEGVDERPLLWSAGTQSPGTFQAEGTHRAAHNPHPTVKPLALMRWLVRLVTPPGGLVLDPFTGSGTTGMACALEGVRFVGFEQDAAYADIARRRIAWAEGEAARAPERLQDGEAVALEDGRVQVSLFAEGEGG